MQAKKFDARTRDHRCCGRAKKRKRWKPRWGAHRRRVSGRNAAAGIEVESDIVDLALRELSSPDVAMSSGVTKGRRGRRTTITAGEPFQMVYAHATAHRRMR
jgi:hypothetical protein